MDWPRSAWLNVSWSAALGRPPLRSRWPPPTNVGRDQPSRTRVSNTFHVTADDGKHHLRPTGCVFGRAHQRAVRSALSRAHPSELDQVTESSRYTSPAAWVGRTGPVGVLEERAMVGLRNSVKGQHRYRTGRPESRACGRSSSASTSTRHSFSTGEKTRNSARRGAPGESIT